MSNHEFQILLIDDDEDEFVNVRDLLLDIKRSKYGITWKSSYEEGLAALKADNFDACLLDYRLGEHTGLELLKEAKKFSISSPVIFLTGQGDFDLDVQAMRIGAADYLVKDELTTQLLERSIRYAMKHALDMKAINESKAQILQQDRLASLGLLASSLAHEIGTPLGIIRSRAELIDRKATENVAIKQNIEIIIGQIDRIAKLVKSLLQLARGKPTEFAAAVSLKQAVDDVLSLVQHELDRKNITLFSDVNESFMVKAESGSLSQVILNLLVNAIHAIEEVKKSGQERDHWIRLKAEDKGTTVRLKVEDSGCGIPPENLPQLFKPFFTTKDVGMGTGLGLATSYNLIHSWGGVIVAKNGDYGAIFEISLNK